MITKPQCRLLGGVIQSSPTNDHPDIYRCGHAAIGVCSIITTDGLIKIDKSPIQGCDKCQFNENIDVVDSNAQEKTPCKNRGLEAIRQDTADLCGFVGVKFDIFPCSIHNECSIHRYCRNQTIKPCATCLQFELPNEANPTVEQ